MEIALIIAIIIYAINISVAISNENWHSMLGWTCCLILLIPIWMTNCI